MSKYKLVKTDDKWFIKIRKHVFGMPMSWVKLQPKHFIDNGKMTKEQFDKLIATGFETYHAGLNVIKLLDK